MRGKRARLLNVLSSRRFLFWAAVVALFVRVAWAVAAGDVQRFYDSDSYVTIADNLRSGQGFLWGDQRIGRPPLYPLLVAAARFELFGREFLALYLIQSMLSAASVLLFAAGARRMIGRAAGGITALLVALDPFLVFYSGAVLSETLFVFFLSALFYGVTLVLWRPRLAGAVLAGLAAGAAFLTRPSVPGVFALLALAIVVWGCPRWKGILCALLMAAVASAVVAPWAVRNHRLTGHWVFTTLGVGASLYDAVGPQADGSSDMSFLHSMPELASMDEYARDSYLAGKAYDAFLDSPGRVARLAWVKAYRFWSPVPNSGDFRSPLYVAASLAATVPVYALAILAIFTGVLRRRDFFVLASAPAYFTLVHTVFVGSTRYRSPVMPFVAMMAAVFITAFLFKGKKGFGAAHAACPPEAGHPDKSGPRARKTPRSHKRRGLRVLVRAFVVLLAVLSLVAAAGYAYYARWLANPENVRALAVEKIGLLFPGKAIKVSHAAFGILSGLDLRDVTVAEPGTLAAVAKLDYVHIDFDRKSLARLTLVPSAVSTSGLYLDLVRAEDGRWNLALPVAEGVPTGRDRLASSFAVTLQGAFVSIDDRKDRYSISFPIDRASIASEDGGLRRWQLAADFGGPLLGKWRLSAKGSLADRAFDANFGAIDIDLGEGLGNRLPPQARSTYDFLKPSGRGDVSGRLAYSDRDGWDFDIKASVSDGSITCQDFPVRVAGVSGELRFTPRGCVLEAVRGAALGGVVECSGAVEGYGGGVGVDMALAVSGAKMSGELTAAMPDAARRAVESLDPAGAFDASVDLSRPRGPNKPFGVSVDVYPKGMSARFKAFPYPVSDLEGRVAYSGNAIDVKDLKGRNGDTEFAFSGTVGNLNGEPEAMITVTAKDLPLDDRLRDLLPERAAAAWKAFALRGTADAVANITRTGGRDAAVAVDARLRGAEIFYEEFPYALASGEGRLVFAGDSVTVESMRFAHDGAEVLIGGHSSVGSGAFAFDVSAKSLEVNEELLGALPAEAAGYIRRLGLAGRGDVSLSVSREAGQPVEVSRLECSLESARLALPELPLAVGAARLSFARSSDAIDVKELDGLLFTDDALALLPFVRLAVLARPATKVAASGSVSRAEGKRDWRMSFEAKHLFVDEGLAAGLPGDARAHLEAAGIRGLADVAGTLAYAGKGAGATDYRLSVDCADGGLVLGMPISDLQGRIDVSGRLEGDTHRAAASGSLLGVSVAGRRAGRTEFEIVKGPDEVRINSLTTATLGGVLSGQGRVSLSDGQGYGLTAKVAGMSLADIVEKAFGFHKEGLTGTVDGQLNLLCLSGKQSDCIGSVEANIHDGTLWEVPVIFAMMNVLNLKLPERTKFDSAHLRVQMTENTVLVEELSMSSEPATLFGQGTIGYDGKLDLTFYSQPGRIPVVSLIAGEVGRNIVKAHITGTFASPQVNLVPSGPLMRLFDWTRAQFGGGK
jgi:4-amino-4-deoxy-L-arabinose transferase-like glycosyltransferase